MNYIAVNYQGSCMFLTVRNKKQPKSLGECFEWFRELRRAHASQGHRVYYQICSKQVFNGTWRYTLKHRVYLKGGSYALVLEIVESANYGVVVQLKNRFEYGI